MIGGEAYQYYSVELEVEYDVGVRVSTLECSSERGAKAFVENHQVGDTMNKSKSKSAISSFYP